MVFKDRFNVLLAENGKEAEEFLAKNPVDLILLDILLPDVNGLDLLEKLQSPRPQLRSHHGHSGQGDSERSASHQAGRYEYIIKPSLSTT